MKSFQEIGQFVHTTRTVISREPADSLDKPSKYAGKKLDEILNSWNFSDVMPLCSQLRDWQGQISKSLYRQDLYIAARPGAGKTLPYLCYWMQNILGLSINNSNIKFTDYLERLEKLLYEPETIGKLVIMVPIRQLATQTTEEFKDYFARILASFIGKLVNIAIDTLPFTDGQNIPTYVSVYKNKRDKILNIIDRNLVPLLREKERLYNEYHRLNKGQDGYLETIRNIENESNKIEKQFRNAAKEGLRNIVQGLRGNFAFVAERTGLGPVGDIRRAPVIIAIYESAAAKVFPNLDANSVGLIVCDEAHLVERKKFEDDARPYTIASALYDILNKTKSWKYRLLFLSGTENPNSARNMGNYINGAFGRNIKVISPPSSAANPSDIQIIPDDSLYNEKTILNIIKNPSSNANVIVVFSKRKIDDYAKKCIKGRSGSSLNQIEKGGYHSPKSYSGGLGNVPGMYRGVSKTPGRFGKEDTVKMGKYASKGKEATDIYDPILRLCIENKFGYIYRLDDNAKDYDQRKHDNAIVGRLFQEGKIKTLLATDAIGIGLNITVKNMFIPSIMKPTGGGRMEEMNAAQLAQLLHRTGRTAFKISRIFTPSKFSASVSAALSMSPDQFKSNIVINKFTADMLRSKNFFVDLWRT